MDLSALLTSLEEIPRGEEREKEINHKLLEIRSLIKSLVGSKEDDEEEEDDNEETNDESQNNRVSKNLLAEDVALQLVITGKDLISSVNESTNSSKILTLQYLAELARCELGRCVMRSNNVVGVVTELLQGNCCLETIIQCFRILGNLCYESEAGRLSIVNTPNCLERIYSFSVNEDKIRSEDPGQRFPVILPAFLLNFCNDSPQCAEAAGEIGFISVIAKNIIATKTNDAVFNSSLSFLECLTEISVGIDILSRDPSISSAINHILTYTTSPEVTGATLELIRSLAEDSNMTLQMAKSDLCLTLIDVITNKWKSQQEFDEQRINACNLLVQILSHENSMMFIYKYKNNVFNTVVQWLQCFSDLQLQVTAALAIGNFACYEENSLVLIHNGTSALLIELLKSHQNPAQDLKLQHAVLGCLRNLAVTPSLRRSLIEQGLLEPCLSLTSTLSLINAQPVIYKLLAVLRLVIDSTSDAAVKIGQNAAVVSKFVEWGSTDVKWLKAQSGRLLSTIIKHSSSSLVYQNIVDVGGLPLVTGMLHSSHPRMLNEALIACTILASTLTSPQLMSQLQTDYVINGIKNICTGSKNPIEIKKNALSLTKKLLECNSSDFKILLKNCNFVEDALSTDDALRETEERSSLIKLLQ